MKTLILVKYMNKRNIIIISILSIILVVICTIAGTYAVIINVVSENGVDKIVNKINIRDLVTDADGSFNKTYYDLKKELNITEEEAEVLIESVPLNEVLDKILESIVQYKLHNNVSAKYSNDELYDMIVTGINKTDSISEELKTKVINKTSYYKQDISDYVYDIEVSFSGES